MGGGEDSCRRDRAAVLSCLVGVALWLAAVAPATAQEAGRPVDPAARAAFLRTEIATARVDRNYLVLDAAQEVLILRRMNVDLLCFPVRARVLAPRGPGAAPVAWLADRFSLEVLPPEVTRHRIEAPPPTGGGQPGPAPQTVEMIEQARLRRIASVPARYRLDFAPGLQVVVQGDEAFERDRARNGASGWFAHEVWRDLVDRGAGRTPRMRIVLRMDEADARRLYLALEPDLPLLIAPAASASGG